MLALLSCQGAAMINVESSVNGNESRDWEALGCTSFFFTTMDRNGTTSRDIKCTYQFDSIHSLR
jgi:hypothetical protein